MYGSTWLEKLSNCMENQRIILQQDLQENNVMANWNNIENPQP